MTRTGPYGRRPEECVAQAESVRNHPVQLSLAQTLATKRPIQRLTAWLLGYPTIAGSYVRPDWLLRLRVKNELARRKTRVGFGPIVAGENDLANRKWEIDPIVNYINSQSAKFVCDVFFERDEIRKFDVVILVKERLELSSSEVTRIQSQGTRLVFNTSDSIAEKPNYFAYKDLLRRMNGIIVENPLTLDDLKDINPRIAFITTPLINKRYKESYEANGPVQIFWEGYKQNIEPMERLNKIVRQLARDVDGDVRMVYHVNGPPRDDGLVRHVPWTRSAWEDLRVGADVGVVIKPIDDPVQQRKPAAKVQTFMASGLPVVCTPTPADELCLTNGLTGFFAHTDKEWYDYLKALVTSRELRERMGRAARKAAEARWTH